MIGIDFRDRDIKSRKEEIEERHNIALQTRELRKPLAPFADGRKFVLKGVEVDNHPYVRCGMCPIGAIVPVIYASDWFGRWCEAKEAKYITFAIN